MPKNTESSEAFFKSIPELKTHFDQAVTRHPQHSQGLLLMADLLEALSLLPRELDKRTAQQKKEHAMLRQQFSIMMETMPFRNPVLRHEFDEAEKIIARHLRPTVLSPASKKLRDDPKGRSDYFRKRRGF